MLQTCWLTKVGLRPIQPDSELAHLSQTISWPEPEHVAASEIPKCRSPVLVRNLVYM